MRGTVESSVRLWHDQRSGRAGSPSMVRALDAHKLPLHVPAALWESRWTTRVNCRGRTSGMSRGMTGAHELLGDVPAALCECWAQGVSTQERAPPLGN